MALRIPVVCNNLLRSSVRARPASFGRIQSSPVFRRHFSAASHITHPVQTCPTTFETMSLDELGLLYFEKKEVLKTFRKREVRKKYKRDRKIYKAFTADYTDTLLKDMANIEVEMFQRPEIVDFDFIQARATALADKHAKAQKRQEMRLARKELREKEEWEARQLEAAQDILADEEYRQKKQLEREEAEKNKLTPEQLEAKRAEYLAKVAATREAKKLKKQKALENKRKTWFSSRKRNMAKITTRFQKLKAQKDKEKQEVEEKNAASS